MNKEHYLLKLLAGIFVVQAGLFSGAVIYCGYQGGLTACPEINERFDKTFQGMISVTLALLVGNQVR